MASEKVSRVLVFMGMVASGKSYLAEAIVQKTSCLYINSDTVRKEIAGLSSDSRQWLPVDSGIYSPEMSRKTYDAMLQEAKEGILRGERLIIVDGSYNKSSERKLVKNELEHLCDLLFVYCYCAEEVSYARMNIRKEDVAAISDGRPLIYEHQLKTYQLPKELGENELTMLDTDMDVKALINKIV